MPAKFSDTNVLLYLFDEDIKKVQCVRHLSREGLTISTQVLNEMANVLRGKWRRDWSETRYIIGEVSHMVTVQSLDHATHRLGLDMAERYHLSVYDGLIVAAALLAGCDTLYSEDMHDGLVVDDRLRIVDPFRAAAG